MSKSKSLRFCFLLMQGALVVVFLLLWLGFSDSEQSGTPNLQFSEVRLQTDQKHPFALNAGHAEMHFQNHWEMRLKEIEPFTSGDFSVQPEELLFYPKSGQVILKQFNLPDLINIEEVVIHPSMNNVSFEGLEVDYQFVEPEKLHWDHWKVNRLKSRDILQHWSRLMNFFKERKVASPAQTKTVGEESKTLESVLLEQEMRKYRVRVGEISLHQSILHFRIGVKDLDLETPQGRLKSKVGRLKLNPLVLTTTEATLNGNRNIKRASFNLQTGELKLE